MKRLAPATVVLLAGISAALHIGKLPPALPVLRDVLHISLLQAGFLLSMVQLAGMTLGLALGAAADGIGPRRTMVLGLLILSAASIAGGAATTVETLLALRAVEGVGFLLAALPAPGLIRQLVAPARLNAMLGLWGAYMPFGTAAALLVGPALIALAGWPGWWWLLAALSLVMAVLVWLGVPPEADQRRPAGSRRAGIARTLRSPGPWLASLAFAVYSAQWLTVIGFLPTIYAQAGLPAAQAALASAGAAAVNMAGNIAAGRLLQRGATAGLLLQCGYLAMGLGAVLAFAPGDQGPVLRYAGVLLFSTVGGLVPGTLFALSVRVAPDPGAVSTTVGWMQQWSSFGQFVGPPVAAWAAARAGGWHVVWWISGAFALAGMGIAVAIAQLLARQRRAGPTAKQGAA
jgi:CP family cyanate transporter-like MFS transporter